MKISKSIACFRKAMGQYKHSFTQEKAFLLSLLISHTELEHWEEFHGFQRLCVQPLKQAFKIPPPCWDIVKLQGLLIDTRVTHQGTVGGVKG